jgi:hypothetical protein
MVVSSTLPLAIALARSFEQSVEEVFDVDKWIELTLAHGVGALVFALF